MGASFSKQKPYEELANALTHGIGTFLSIAALAILSVFSFKFGDAVRISSFIIYGLSLFALYMSSTLYHSFPAGKIKKFFHLLDHSSIFLLIAGTYTPVLLISLEGVLGWTFFFIIWGIAFLGITVKIFYTGKFNFLSISLYLCMGWMLVFLLKPMLEKAPLPLLLWLLTGGIFYTSGIIFYLWKKLPFHHSVWHIFVMLGSISHFLGIIIYLSSAN